MTNKKMAVMFAATLAALFVGYASLYGIFRCAKLLVADAGGWRCYSLASSSLPAFVVALFKPSFAIECRLRHRLTARVAEDIMRRIQDGTYPLRIESQVSRSGRILVVDEVYRDPNYGLVLFRSKCWIKETGEYQTTLDNGNGTRTVMTDDGDDVGFEEFWLGFYVRGAG